MQRLSKIVWAAFAVVAALSLAAGPAAARNRIEVSTTALLTSGRLTFNSALADVICDITLHSTRSRLIDKARGTVIGRVTAILTANARNNIGAAAACAGLPIELIYDSITGSLPSNITGATINAAGAFLLRVGNAGCLIRDVVKTISTENPIRRVSLEPSPRQLNTTTLEEEFFRRCPSQGEIVGQLAVSPEVTLRLLER